MKELKQKQNLSLFLVAFSFARFHRLNTPPILRVPLAGNIRPFSKPQQNDSYNVQTKMIDKYIGQQRKWDQQKIETEKKRLQQLEEAKKKREARKIQTQKVVKNMTSVPSGTLLSTLLSAVIFLIAVVLYVTYAKDISTIFFPANSSSKSSQSFSASALPGVQGAQNLVTSSSTSSNSNSNASTSQITSSLTSTSSASSSSSATSKVRVENIALNLFNASDDSNIVNISLAQVSMNPIQTVVDKVSELPSNYIPTDLVTLNLSGGGQLKQEAAKLLSDMFADAHSKGIDLKVLSAFRSFSDQRSLYNSYVDAEMKNGAADRDAAIKIVNTYSAKPGHSEHQLGTTADIICDSENDFTESECNLKAWKYIADNSYKFGYKISYPKDNSYGFKYEPWHIRYWGL